MKAILSKTASGSHLSKIIEPQLCRIVLDVYMTASDFANLVMEYDEKPMEVVVIDKQK